MISFGRSTKPCCSRQASSLWSSCKRRRSTPSCREGLRQATYPYPDRFGTAELRPTLGIRVAAVCFVRACLSYYCCCCSFAWSAYNTGIYMVACLRVSARTSPGSESAPVGAQRMQYDLQYHHNGHVRFGCIIVVSNLDASNAPFSAED